MGPFKICNKPTTDRSLCFEAENKEFSGSISSLTFEKWAAALRTVNATARTIREEASKSTFQKCYHTAWLVQKKGKKEMPESGNF